MGEAFASVPLAWLAEPRADEEHLDLDGGAVARCHPLDASGLEYARG